MMATTMIITLVLLSLVDSTSFGTLLIPVWLLTAPGRLKVNRILLYLLTVAGFYFLVGILLVMGVGAFFTDFRNSLNSAPILIGQLVLGLALFIVSWAMDAKGARFRAAERAAAGGGRLLKWRNRIMRDGDAASASAHPLIALAVSAVVLELATMLPYLAAIGIITTNEAPLPITATLLAGYCLVMITPALILLVARVFSRQLLEEPLARMDRWLTKNSQSTTAWIIGIVGFLLAVNAVADLGWIETGV